MINVTSIQSKIFVLLMTVLFSCLGKSFAAIPPAKLFAAQINCSKKTTIDRVRSQDVQIPQKGGGTLDAKIFAPDANSQSSPCPVISILPGGGAGIESVEWAANRLAAGGYIVIITKPELRVSLNSYNTAVKSGIDFMLSSANPYIKDTDTEKIGIAGWSLGARVLSQTQEEDLRVDAMVAWDNFAVSETGDEGSPLCRNQPQTIRKPRVPALGQASDGCRNKSSEAKKTAFEHWKATSIPTMQVVFAGANHFFWSARASTESKHDLSHYYTQAWFDRWLKNDKSATQRLLARNVAGNSLESLLSSIYTSGAFFDNFDCKDLRKFCHASQK